MLQSQTVIYPASATKHTLFNKKNTENLYLIALFASETTYVSRYETDGSRSGNFPPIANMKHREGVIMGDMTVSGKYQQERGDWFLSC